MRRTRESPPLALAAALSATVGRVAEQRVDRNHAAVGRLISGEPRPVSRLCRQGACNPQSSSPQNRSTHGRSSISHVQALRGWSRMAT
jgi:hypothetical protein